jgi:apolipoprotein D and lipocalin family protein
MSILKLAPLLLMALVGCATKPAIQTVEKVDLPRFMGDWYVIALLPWFGERGHVNTMDIYALRADGKMDVTYAFRKGSLDAPRKEWKAKAWIQDTETNAHWKVQFVWPFAADYLVLSLSPDYQTTVIGHPSRKLAWVMARSPQISEDAYRRACAALDANGFDASRLERVPQPSK